MAMTRGGKALLVTSVGVSMSALDTTMVNVARDTIARDLHGSDAAVSWVLSGYSIVFAAVLLTSGRLADRYGRKRIYTTGLLVFVASSAACALAPNLNLLIAARAVQAVGAALIAPAALALVLPEFPVERRSAALAVWGIIGSTAAAAGPTLGSILIDAWGWRSAFFINVPLGLAGFVAGRKILQESVDPTAQGVPDIVGILAGVGAVGILALAITQGNDWGFAGGPTLVCYAVTAVALPVFVWRCRAARLPVLDLALLKGRTFSSASAAALLFSVPFYGSLVADVSFLQRQWHYSVLGAGVAVKLTPAASVVVARTAGRWCDAYGHRRVLVPGSLILALSLFLRAGLISSGADYWTRLAIPFALTGVGLGILIPGLQSATLKYLPHERIAMGSAFYTTVRQLGAALGVAITVALLSRPGVAPLDSFRLSWIVQGAVAMTVAVIVLFAYRPPAEAATH